MVSDEGKCVRNNVHNTIVLYCTYEKKKQLVSCLKILEEGSRETGHLGEMQLSNMRQTSAVLKLRKGKSITIRAQSYI
jgi:hypothetical protein